VTPALVALGLVAGAWLLVRIRTLPPAADLVPAVSIVVPARDEAGSIPRLLASVAALDPAPAEVLVVDDGSTDGTAALAAAAGARVVDAGVLPAGWLGKPWACQRGADASTGELLLFLDADTWLEPDAVGRLVAAHTGGLLSVQPFHVTERAGEQLSAFPNVVSMMGTGAFSPLLGAASGAAFGPCLLTSRADYVAVGGHAVVKAAVAEDVELARRYAALGLPVRAFAGRGAVSFRMYPDGLRQLVDGWSKNLAAGATRTRSLAVVGAAAWVTACVAIVVGSVRGEAWAFVAWAAVSAHLGWILQQVGRFRWWVAVAFPVPLSAFVVLFARSAALHLLGRPATWRGRLVAVR
jgi:4,4'-diaponeurosporenoate glycosyltransferase